MSSERAKLLEKSILMLLLASLTLPMALGICLRFTDNLPTDYAWLRNATLKGVQIKPKLVSFTRHNLITGEFQTAYADSYNADFPWREVLIRLADEFYLRVFHSSPVGVVVGPGDNLHEKAYVEEYTVLRQSRASLLPLVEDLRKMQDFCTAQKIAFVFAITPSKAAVLPETVPAAWLKRRRPEPRCYEILAPLLREHRINFVDGHAIALAAKNPHAPPVFPRGGVHWGDQAAFDTTNAILELFRKQGLGVMPVRDYTMKISNLPSGQDGDLAHIINTIFVPRYPVANVTVKPVDIPREQYRPNLVVVGGSFTDKILAMFGDSRQFSEIDFYSYYRLRKECILDGEALTIAEPVPPLSFKSDVFAADSILLELNEQAMYGSHHITRFLHDALAVLPRPGTAKAPFQYEGGLDYQWNDILSFETGKAPAKILKSNGFAAPAKFGSFTEKPLAWMRLTTPAATSDIVLEVTALPYLGSGKILHQAANVAVNGRPVGRMIWSDPKATLQTLTIPKGILSGGETLFEFQMENAASPAALGIGADHRVLGICIATLQLRETGAGAIGPHPEEVKPLDYDWGKKILLREKEFFGGAGLKNFSPPGAAGSFTIGPTASFRLRTPPAPRNMLLSVEANAFVDYTGVDRQIVDVYVNHHPVGRWTWPSGTPEPHTAVIPKEFLNEPETELEFRVDHPVSPADLGLGGDTRQLGICVTSIQFQPVVR